MYTENFKVRFTIRQGDKILRTNKEEDLRKMQAQKAAEQQPQIPQPVSPQMPLINPNIDPNMTILRQSKPGSRFNFTIARTTTEPQPNNPPQDYKPSNQMIGVTYSNKSRLPQLPEYLLPTISGFLDMIFRNYGREDAIEISKRLGLYYKDPNMRSQQPQRRPQQNDQTFKQPQHQLEQERMEESFETATNQDSIPKQTEGLFPTKPKTAEEIEAEEISARHENVAMGFIGEPVVDTMKQKQALPKLKNDLVSYLTGFEPQTTEIATLRYLVKTTEDLLAADIAKLMNTDTKEFKVDVSTAVDTRNRKCYEIKITNYSSPVFTAIVYPKEIEIQKKEERKIAAGINPLEVSTSIQQNFKEITVKDFLWQRAQAHKLTVESGTENIDDRKVLYFGYISQDLKTFAGIPEDQANTLTAQYVNMYFPFDKKPEDDEVGTEL